MEAIDLLDFAHYVGYTIYSAQTNERIGLVKAVDETTINTLLSVVRDDSNEELILPIAEELLVSVLPEDKSIHLQIPDGLLDI